MHQTRGSIKFQYNYDQMVRQGHPGRRFLEITKLRGPSDFNKSLTPWLHGAIRFRACLNRVAPFVFAMFHPSGLEGPRQRPKLRGPTDFNKSLARVVLNKAIRVRDWLNSLGHISLGHVEGPLSIRAWGMVEGPLTHDAIDSTTTIPSNPREGTQLLLLLLLPLRLRCPCVCVWPQSKLRPSSSIMCFCVRENSPTMHLAVLVCM